MSILIRCPYCKNEYGINLNKCPKCDKPAPKRNRVYRVAVTHNGRRVRKSIPGNLELAKEIEAKIKSELVLNTYYDRRKQVKLEMQFEGFFQKKYLPYAKNNKISWMKEEQLNRIWINPVLGKKKLNDISSFDIERLKKNMTEASRSPKTINYAIDVIRMAFNMAIKWGYAKNNPAVGVKRPKKDNRRIRFLTPEEANMLLAECRQRSQQLYEIAFLSLYTGMRFGEIANLKWGDIDFNNDIINIKDPKNATNRVVYMTPTIKKMLQKKKYTQTNELIFKDRNGERMQAVSKTFSRVVQSLGFNDDIEDKRNRVVFHTLRHTFASWLAINGTPIYTISKLMGHKTMAMTERYSHLSPDSKRNAVKSIENILDKKIIEGNFEKQSKE